MKNYVSISPRFKLFSDQGIAIRFDNCYYQTGNEKEIAFLDRHPLLNREFFPQGTEPKRRKTDGEEQDFDIKKVFRYGQLAGKLFNDEGKVKPALSNKEELLAEYESLKTEIGEIQ